jgi:hypothetical protein
MEEVLEFGPAESDKLRFRIHTGEDVFAIEKHETTVTVVLPRSIVQAWTTTALVGIEQTITTPQGRDIYVIVEKDFACLDGDREEEAGSYPNPMEDVTC